MSIDLSVQIKRNPDVQNYQVNLLIITPTGPGNFETYICQSLPEVMQRIADFECKHLNLFQNTIEYEKTDWRELARQNRSANSSNKAA